MPLVFWLLLLLALGEQPGRADTGVELTPSTEAGQGDQLNTLDPESRADSPRSEADPPFAQRHQSELLAMAGLFFLWLLARLFTPSPETAPRAREKRYSPVNAEELGRILYRVGQGNDPVAYRNLYLTGSEAASLMGQETALVYLERRTAEVMQMAYEHLHAQLPKGSRYTSTLLDNDDKLLLVINDAMGSARRIPVAQVGRVGAVLRLISPVAQPAAEPQEDVEDWITE